MTVEQVIRAYSRTPLWDSTGPVAMALAGCSVLVGIEGKVPPPGGTLLLRVGPDNAGRMWAFAYTNDRELARSLPPGCECGCAAVPFPDFFRLVEADPTFTGGLIINSASDTAFPFFRQMFPQVKQAIAAARG